MSNVGGNAVQTQNYYYHRVDASRPDECHPKPAKRRVCAASARTHSSPPLPTPFNIAITWGSGAQDLDLYLTVPNGSAQTVYYGNPGSSTTQPYAFYHYDSTVPNGGEVITVSRWNTGGTYTAYVQDFTNGVINPQS